MSFLSWQNSTIQIRTLIPFKRHVTVLSPRCLFFRLFVIAGVRHMKCISSWNLLVWEVIVGPSSPQKLISIPHALVRVWACKVMYIDINKQHLKVFHHWPPAPIWYPWSQDSFNIPFPFYLSVIYCLYYFPRNCAWKYLPTLESRNRFPVCFQAL